MSNDKRIQTFRERVPIIAKMVESAFNGDAHQHDDRVGFAIICANHHGDCSMMGNLGIGEAMRLMLTIVAQQERGEGEDIKIDEPVGHA